MQRLSAQDASFLDVEDPVSHMHIGAVAILEGGAARGSPGADSAGAAGFGAIITAVTFDA